MIDIFPKIALWSTLVGLRATHPQGKCESGVSAGIPANIMMLSVLFNSITSLLQFSG